MRVIDMHTHIFPRQVARKATAAVADYFGQPEPPHYDGTAEELSNLLAREGIAYALIFSAATTPHQVEAIDRYIWSEAVKESRFLPCGTLHAGYEGYRAELAWMRSHGIHGINSLESPVGIKFPEIFGLNVPAAFFPICSGIIHRHVHIAGVCLLATQCDIKLPCNHCGKLD